MPLTLLSYPSLDPLILEPAPDPRNQTNLFGAGQWISEQWKGATREVLEDLRSKRSWRPIFYFLSTCWVAFLAFSISMLAISSYGTSLQQSDTSACKPDGNFSPYANTYNAWGSSGFFQITLAFGSLSFTSAKVIDICWDMIVGRAGQAALAFFSWNVFSDYVTTSMDVSPITYQTFWVIFLHKEPTLFSVIRLTRDFVSYRRLNSIVAMVFMIATIIFALVFPTLASAMTGYTPVNKAFVQNENGNLVPFSDFQVVAYIIHDGSRVNLTNDAYITRVFYRYNMDPVVWKGDDEMEYYGCSGVERCRQLDAVSKYTSSFGFYGNNNTASTWENTTIPTPTLNISAYYIPPGELFGNNWIDPQTKQKPFNDISRITYLSSNKTYPLSYVEENGACQPVLNEYQWGFSFTQLFIVLILMFIWTIGISIMWLAAHLKLPLRDHPEVPQGWKAVILLAQAIDKELPDADIDAHALKDRQVKHEIQKHLRGGSIRFDAYLTQNESKSIESLRNHILEQTHRNRWWWMFLIVATAPITLAAMFGLYVSPGGVFLLSVFGCAVLGVLLALAIGSTTRSKLFVTSFWVLAGLVVFIGVCASGVLNKYRHIR